MEGYHDVSREMAHQLRAAVVEIVEGHDFRLHRLHSFTPSMSQPELLG